MTIAFFVVESILFGLFAWLGLYILTRDYPDFRARPRQWQRPATFAGVGTLLFAGFILGVAMQSVATTAVEYILWQKLTWWTVPLGAVLYAGATLLLYGHLQTGAYPAILRWKSYWTLLALALVIGVGTTTDWFLRYELLSAVATPFEAFHVPFRLPCYYGYALFVAGLLVGASLLLLKGAQVARHRSAAGQIRWRWLGIGGAIIMAGGMLSIVGYALVDRLLPEQLGDLVVATGAAVVGYGVAKHRALEQQFALARDFQATLLRVLVTALGYNLFFWGACAALGYAAPPFALPLLLLLAIIPQTHSIGSGLGWSVLSCRRGWPTIGSKSPNSSLPC